MNHLAIHGPNHPRPLYRRRELGSVYESIERGRARAKAEAERKRKAKK